jgi:hypothetical protein
MPAKIPMPPHHVQLFQLSTFNFQLSFSSVVNILPTAASSVSIAIPGLALPCSAGFYASQDSNTAAPRAFLSTFNF